MTAEVLLSLRALSSARWFYARRQVDSGITATACFEFSNVEVIAMQAVPIYLFVQVTPSLLRLPFYAGLPLYATRWNIRR